MIAVGIIQCTFGLKGDFKVWSEGSTIEKLKLPFKVFIGRFEEESKIFTLEKAVKRGKSWICNVSELKEVDAVKSVLGMYIFIEEKFLPELEEGTFYHFDLEGIRVLTKDNIEIGRIIKVYNFPSSDCIEIERKEGRNIVIPLIKEAIISVNIKSGYMVVNRAFLEELF